MIFLKKWVIQLKKWAKYTKDRIWIPVQLTLPVGALYPIDVKGEMKWAFAKIVEIPEEERSNHPSEGNNEFYGKKFDEENPEIFETFMDGFSMLNDLVKNHVVGVETTELPDEDGTDG